MIIHLKKLYCSCLVVIVFVFAECLDSECHVQSDASLRKFDLCVSKSGLLMMGLVEAEMSNALNTRVKAEVSCGDWVYIDTNRTKGMMVSIFLDSRTVCGVLLKLKCLTLRTQTEVTQNIRVQLR